MSSSQLNASLLRLKLLDALRSGETAKVDAIINELTSTKSTIKNIDIVQLHLTILHYAVQVAPLATLQYLCTNAQKYNLDINAQDQDGNTPLHLAAMSSRFDIVKYLLSLPEINDTIVNLNKKQPVEECKDLSIAQLMQIERAKFVEQSASKLRQYFSNRDMDNLEKLLVSNPRASELLDINGADPETGNTVLHEFIKHDDIQMCDWILKHGGDPFKRDKRGKLPIDLINGKNDPLKKLLKVASKDQTIMDPVVNTSNAIKSGGAPTYKGYLRKWTNFASGYKLRYFQLDQNGILSYYTNQDDTNNACRGSLNLGFATLHLDSSEKLKFEIIGKNGMRWHLKANHPIETNRWVWTLQNAITIAKDNIKRKNKGLIQAEETAEQSSIKGAEEHEGRKHRFHIPGRRSLSRHRRTDSNVSLNSEIVDSSSLSRSSTLSKKAGGSPNLAQINESKPVQGLVPPQSRLSVDDQSSFNAEASDVENFDYDLDDNDFDSDTGSIAVNSDPSRDKVDGPLADQISTVKRSLDVELSSLLDLFNQVINSRSSAGNEESSSASSELGVCNVGLSTLNTIQDLFQKYDSLIQSRESKFVRKLERQVEVNKLWENSIKQLEDEIHQREAKLAEYDGKKKQLKKYFSASKVSGSNSPAALGPSDSYSGSIDAASEVPGDDKVIETIFNDSDEEFFDADEFEDAEESDAEVPDINIESAKEVEADIRNENAPSVGATIGAAGVAGVAGAAIAGDKSHQEKSSTAPESSKAKAVEKESISEEERTVQTEESIETSNSNLNSTHSKVNEMIQQEGSFLGYENPPRQKLSMDEDNRPKVGLWGILKSMIGKDMTRMTLPVAFNEPCSLIQRLAEDVEYSGLLDQAATFDDSTLRLLYVATFASSLYSSSVGRIAKPFNPLLGETFEYSRPDKNYRLLGEQVSHHPPVSACAAESPKWDYYGHNEVDTSFKGRSFDIKHLGKMFCTLRPDNGVVDSKGQKVDHEVYSWKKVNNSVVGIIMGNPTIDVFGQMEVKNFTTGDSIIVDFKQRGWKASSAYQLSGQVIDKKGTPRWALGGHWNSKIFGKKISGSESGQSLDNAQGKVSSDPYSGQKFLMWEVAPRPKVPFNLTAFATSLNGIDDNLKGWLAPTDTRLRPDQRAMEEGEYDLASSEKHRVEEKQRSARKKREQTKTTYKPNWFTKDKHPITGDSYWRAKGDYWAQRKEHNLAKSGDIF
ncbi:uncharacterized protein CANTADRAFT_339537 [Suhomyces tanzawaensis NRRL Y-17324]|uniref:PH domain-containing protein n=1 Tax=Suhomyces tanzawaensis NRRL Y-17324 TaxID=984487 RepID=A0A1E4SI37_9ASCO|nr:uncharacterized protein CANTADRAFT_339537 [Suhomyces tanzawaensis NRRL Y-17324]ODV79179.1 hypothetical protein CANTADRAFT_339537 [Suhomyces tanzawaensis NRRL Y-17324]